MIVKIDRDLKIRLLEALKSGEINTEKFPEITSDHQIIWNETRTYECGETDCPKFRHQE